MRTWSMVHSPKERLAQRQLGERLALRSQWRLVACVSILRTAVTGVLPLAGAAAWWVTLACLLPGLLLYALGCLGLRMTNTDNLPDCLRALLGQAGAWVICLMVAAALVLDSLCSMTVLITFFTQGIGSAGQQWTLAAVAAGMLLFCLNREGLARGCYFLRRLMLALTGIVLLGLIGMGRVDHLAPWLGDGQPGVSAAIRAGIGMGWVFVLPLMEPPVRVRHMAAPLAPALLCVAAVGCINLALPHELLVTHAALADSVVQTVAYQVPAVRLAAICLWMLGLFLCLGSTASLGTKYVLASTGRELVWLPGVIVVIAAALQATDVCALWQGLRAAVPWLLLPLAAGAVLSLLAGWRRRA